MDEKIMFVLDIIMVLLNIFAFVLDISTVNIRGIVIDITFILIFSISIYEYCITKEDKTIVSDKEDNK